MIRRPPRSTLSSSSAASDVYKRQGQFLTPRGAHRQWQGQRKPRLGSHALRQGDGHAGAREGALHGARRVEVREVSGGTAAREGEQPPGHGNTSISMPPPQTPHDAQRPSRQSSVSLPRLPRARSSLRKDRVTPAATADSHGKVSSLCSSAVPLSLIHISEPTRLGMI